MIVIILALLAAFVLFVTREEVKRRAPQAPTDPYIAAWMAEEPRYLKGAQSWRP